MMKNIFLALFVTFLAGSTVNAFWKPTRPVQQAAAFSSGDSFLASLDAAASSFDAGLDNTAIEADGNITPSRKWYVSAYALLARVPLACVRVDYSSGCVLCCVCVCVSHRHLLVFSLFFSCFFVTPRFESIHTHTHKHNTPISGFCMG